jgi:hypothetical protein
MTETMKQTIFILVLFVNGNLLFSQTVGFQKLESELILEIQKYRNADYDIKYSLRDKLRNKFENILSDQNSFGYPFDSLANYINIIKSNDNKVRIFSWDELSGGSMHDMAVIVQFITNSNKINTQWIDSDISDEPNGMTDAIQYEIYDVNINNQAHYLCFGWGTYGSGKHHNSILILSIQNNTLKNCLNCIEKAYSIIFAPRTSEINLKYDRIEHVISFNEFTYDDEMDYIPTGERVKLKLKNGKFEKYGD